MSVKFDLIHFTLE